MIVNVTNVSQYVSGEGGGGVCRLTRCEMLQFALNVAVRGFIFRIL